MGRMNEMGSRLDCLEQSELLHFLQSFSPHSEFSCSYSVVFIGITDLMEQAGLDSPPPSPRQNESPVSSPQNENRAVL